MKLFLFGSTGNLIIHKVLPALARLNYPSLEIVALGRRNLSQPDYFDLTKLPTYAKADFLSRIQYQKINFDSSDKALLDKLTDNHAVNYFYLALPPVVMLPTFKLLTDFIQNKPKDKYRFLLEKPFGYDLESALWLVDLINRHKLESQIFLSDHYLFKKEIISLNRRPKQYLGITAIEKVDVADRIGYYDRVGALKDMIQSHFLNIILKLKPQSRVADFKIVNLIKGQYQGYSHELGRSSDTETFVAVKMWLGQVQLDFITGKAMADKQIKIQIDDHTIWLKESNPYGDLFQAFFDNESGKFMSLSQAILTWQVVNKINHAVKKPVYITYPKGYSFVDLRRFLKDNS